jgi:hypothetical protein
MHRENQQKQTLREDGNGVVEENSVQIQNEDGKEAGHSRRSDADAEVLRNADEVDVNKEVGVLQVVGFFLYSTESLDMMFVGATLLSMGLLTYWLQWF